MKQRARYTRAAEKSMPTTAYMDAHAAQKNPLTPWNQLSLAIIRTRVFIN